ncbi:CHASE domain-containing protein [Massilia sp. GCM10020059]|uniref:histidine kinase n=1 Tax=Massilia agrisoli TaxID=2892444 RepID=A0ABS8ITB8_9BURK|nr:CHASE domain-containing protein [Massilia agrisoli]MCC6071670.1 CHASE domain-containing protein [Massilia agrisoli]
MSLSASRRTDETPSLRFLRKHVPLMLGLAVFALSLAATYSAWDIAIHQLQRARQSEFDFQVRQAARRIEVRMETYAQVQRGVVAFLLGSMDVDRDDFRLFVRSLRLDEKYPGIQGLAVVRLVAPGQLEQHVASIRTEGLSYGVHPAGPREVYSLISHIEPFSGLNLRALGFDMLTEPNRRKAMERARDTGQQSASAKVRLIQENGQDVQAGTVMYLPVYRRGASTASVDERRRNLIGWVGAPFRINDLMAGIGGERSKDLIMSIYDGTEVDQGALLFQSHPLASQSQPSQFRATKSMMIGGRPWTMDLRSAPAFETRLESDEPRVIAVVGTALSALLGLLVWALASGQRRAARLANEMTGQLRDSEFRWKYALEGAGDGVWDWNCKTNAVVYSKRWKEMLGYAESELADNLDEWARLLHPDDKATAMAELDRYLGSTDSLYSVEFRMRCKDGSWRWMLARAMAVTRDEQLRPLRTIGTHTDITRAKMDESTLRDANGQLAAEQQRIRVILDHSHDAFVAVDSTGHVTDWNAKAESMFGWSAAEAVGRQLTELIIPVAERDAHERGFRRFTESGGATLIRNVMEVTAMHRSGLGIPVELAIAGLPTANGHAASAFIRDISLRKAAERLEVERGKALDEARAALQHAQKLEAVGKLTGGIAHDFNNVLHVIGGNVQLLQLLCKGDERLQKRLASMQSAVDRGAKLSSQLLAFARRQPLQPLVLDLTRVMVNMDDLLRRALGESVQLAIRADDGLWNTLVDPGQLENVILNLVINARDAMPEGGTVTIALDNSTISGDGPDAAPDLAAGQYVRLTVSDTGTGMSPEVQALAFEPFFTTKPVGKGTGLGLSMAYGFVKQSGGHIQLLSMPGSGTSVVIHLPRSEKAETEAEIAPVCDLVGGGETILVVEDDDEVRETAISQLQELGYTVLHAHDGQSAVTMLEGGVQVDLVFTDVVMPGPVSSTALAQRAKELLPGVRVLYTSGYTRNALTTGGRLDAGVQLLSKPYRREELARRIVEIFARQLP